MRVLGLTLASAFLVSACGGAFTAPSPSPSPTPKPVIVAKTADSSFGKILVDKDGKTVYVWFKDIDENSQCYDACATAWPPMLVETKNIAGEGVTNGKLSATARKDGKLQATYNQQPLYYFVRDTAIGQTNGQGSTGFGALWVVIRYP